MFPLLTGRAVPTCPPGEVVRGSGKPRPVPEVEGKLRGYLVAALEHHFAIWAEDWQIAQSGERRSGKVAAEEPVSMTPHFVLACTCVSLAAALAENKQ